MGKGSRYRPVDRKKWDKAWENYERKKKEKANGRKQETAHS